MVHRHGNVSGKTAALEILSSIEVVKKRRGGRIDILSRSTVGNIIPRSPDKMLLHEHRVTEGGWSRAN